MIIQTQSRIEDDLCCFCPKMGTMMEIACLTQLGVRWFERTCPMSHIPCSLQLQSFLRAKQKKNNAGPGGCEAMRGLQPWLAHFADRFFAL